MHTAETLKAELQEIAVNEYRVPLGETAFGLAQEMMDFVGATDSELRDTLIYTTLAKWAMAGHFAPHELRALLEISLDGAHLFYQLGEARGDGVFTRTFSLLVIEIVIYMHNQAEFLTPAEVQMAKARVLSYLAQEQDMRGYVHEEEKGWAHAVAHASDVLQVLALSTAMGQSELREILEAIRTTMAIDTLVYTHEEDERMVSAVVGVLERGILSPDEIVAWIQSFGAFAALSPFWRQQQRRTNIRNFLRSLYFRVLSRPNFEYVSQPITETVGALIPYK